MIIQFFSILKLGHSLSLTNIIIYIQQKEGKNSEAYISRHGSETDHFQSHALEIKQNVQSYLPKKIRQSLGAPEQLGIKRGKC